MPSMPIPLRLASYSAPRTSCFTASASTLHPRLLSNSAVRHAEGPNAPEQAQTSPQLAQQEGNDLENTSHSTPAPSSDQVDTFAQHLKRRRLAPSRYHYRSPRYYRGPLHPHQPPPKTSPASREYVPGPFSLPRMLQTHESVVEADLMTLFYHHVPPGTHIPERAPRLRSWDDSSPYYKNRPLRAPRGRPALPLLREQVTFRNVPTMDKISISTLLREGASKSETTHVAYMVLQAITSKKATVHIAKKGSTGQQASDYKMKAGKPIALSVQLQGEQMWHFLSTFLTVVLPKIKDWPGVKARSGDRSGNYGIGLKPDVVGLWPEIAVNYDAYPSKMIPSLDIKLETTAATDRDARLLLSALGVPFVSGGNR